MAKYNMGMTKRATEEGRARWAEVGRVTGRRGGHYLEATLQAEGVGEEWASGYMLQSNQENIYDPPKKKSSAICPKTI